MSAPECPPGLIRYVHEPDHPFDYKHCTPPSTTTSTTMFVDYSTMSMATERAAIAAPIDQSTTALTYDIGTPPIPPGGLPETGVDAAVVGFVGLIILLVGIFLRDVSRKRKP